MSVKLGNRTGTASGAGDEANAHLGVDAGDFDNDGDEDLCITTPIGQGSTRYVHDGTGSFEEQRVGTHIRLTSLLYTGFGAAGFNAEPRTARA